MYGRVRSYLSPPRCLGGALDQSVSSAELAVHRDFRAGLFALAPYVCTLSLAPSPMTVPTPPALGRV